MKRGLTLLISRKEQTKIAMKKHIPPLRADVIKMMIDSKNRHHGPTGIMVLFKVLLIVLSVELSIMFQGCGRWWLKNLRASYYIGISEEDYDY